MLHVADEISHGDTESTCYRADNALFAFKMLQLHLKTENMTLSRTSSCRSGYMCYTITEAVTLPF